MSNVTRRDLLSMSAVVPLAGILFADKLPKGASNCPPKYDPDSDPVQNAVRRTLQQRYFPNVPLVTQDGKKVRFYDDLVRDKIVVINIFYAHCKVACTPIGHNLAQVQKLLGDRMGRDIFFNSITIKPEEDTPHELKKFARMLHAGPGWNFLTGKPEDVELLRQSLRFTDYNPRLDKDKSRHSGMLRVGNEPYTLWTSCQARAKPEAIAQEIGWVIRPVPGRAAAIPSLGQACTVPPAAKS